MKLIRTQNRSRLKGEEQYTDQYLAKVARDFVAKVARALKAPSWEVLSAKYSMSRRSGDSRSRYLDVEFVIDGYLYGRGDVAHVILYQSPGETFYDRLDSEVDEELLYFYPSDTAELKEALESAIASITTDPIAIGLNYGLKLKVDLLSSNENDGLPLQLKSHAYLVDVVDLPEGFHAVHDARDLMGELTIMEDDETCELSVSLALYGPYPKRSLNYDTTEWLTELENRCKELREEINGFVYSERVDIEEFTDQVSAFLPEEYRELRYHRIHGDPNKYEFSIPSPYGGYFYTNANVSKVTPKQVASRFKGKLTRISNEKPHGREYHYEVEL